MKSAISFTRNPLPYLFTLLFVTAIGVSVVAPKSISLAPDGPSPNPYAVVR